MAKPQEAVARLAASPEVAAHLRRPGTGVYIVEQDGRIVWASPSMREATGRPPEDLLGRNGWDVFVPPEDLQEVAHFKALLADSDGLLWMRLRMPGPGERREWYRVDTWVREGLIACAFRREPDPSMHRIHFQMRPRP